MKKLSIALFAFVFCASAFAQTPEFRAKGYKGSVSIFDQLGVYVGVETSHGLMLDSHNYIGVGANLWMFPNGEKNPTFANAFLDYHNYLKDTKSTPVLGVKTGLMHSFKYDEDSGITLKNGIFVEPNFGWSWALSGGKTGFTTTFSVPVLTPLGDNRMSHKVSFMPKISFTLEF